MVDPADGQQKPWGEIKSERLRQADYTRKTMELAELRRQFAAEKAAEKAAAIAAQVKQATDLLPEDDPYAAGQRLLFQQMNALTQAQEQERQWMEQQRVATARARLETEEAQASEMYKLAPKERDIVGQQLYARISSGDHTASFSTVAKEFAEWRDALRKEAEEAGVKSWLEKHRVGTGTVAAPPPAAAGTPPQVALGPLSPRSLTIAINEGWRGEVCHVAITDAQARFARYKVVDPQKAATLGDPKAKPYLVDQATGTKMFVPRSPKVGPLRQSAVNLAAGKVYFAFFSNRNQVVKPGSKVTVVIGDFKVENLAVQ